MVRKNTGNRLKKSSTQRQLALGIPGHVNLTTDGCPQFLLLACASLLIQRVVGNDGYGGIWKYRNLVSEVIAAYGLGTLAPDSKVPEVTKESDGLLTFFQ